MAVISRKYGVWFGLMVMMLVILLSGCSFLLQKDLSKMTPEEEKKVKEASVNYIKTTYGKGYVVEEVRKDHVFGETYFINGYIEDGKKTPVALFWTPPDPFQDTYVDRLWTNELRPQIKELVKKTMDLRKMEHFTYGYRDGVERKYKGDIPSVFDILKKGEKDFSLNVTFEIYQHGGQEKEDITNFLHELKKMNFNKVTVTIFVYNDQLKSAPKSEDSGKYLLRRYNISGDIQTLDLKDLDKYKTEIKHSK
ncbi:hypothetical protein ACFO25_00665 [Paenactinomyces guangxiensis]|uniref:Uncharacterized protein n=1 Tax=Paenactinomyces guangxiensis TaxID=1490290 RepID=A0A7W1WUX5_9BACL|nr:hypothetical protein [Paenactinomyces guangxiensis]MBA4496407.1 hypothetical protein [Paenactinomyces guangxiensis]MBH8593478.1 hypothetical protein [Paenactinomyces guangxiensis]